MLGREISNKQDALVLKYVSKKKKRPTGIVGR